MEEDYIKLVFGLKLKQVRTQRELSLLGLSKLTGLSKSYLNEIEKGKKYPKTDKIILLAEKLEVPYDKLVSLQLDKNLAPIAEIFQSKILKEIPLQLFGIKESDLIEIVANAPAKVNAFISTLIEIAKHYNFGKENFYLAALRSYQEANNNFFGEIEDKVLSFAKEYHVDLNASVNSKELEEILLEEYHYKIDTIDHSAYKELENLRSVFVPKTKTLLIAPHMDEAQRTFIYAKEIAYNYLSFKDRPYTFSWIKFDNFDEVLNNFYASYFAGALIIPRKLFKKDIDSFIGKSTVNQGFLDSISKSYNASPESLYHRLTNLLPHDYQLENLFFLRFGFEKGSDYFNIDKELHLTHQHSPHGNETDEKYCRRWVSIKVLQEIADKDLEHVVDYQISYYPDTDLSYLIMASATKNPFNDNRYRSVGIGLLINDTLKKKIKFLKDANIKTVDVGVTCERCAIVDCAERRRPPLFLQKKEKNNRIEELVNDLQQKYG